MFRNTTHQAFLTKFQNNHPHAEEYTFLSEYIASNAPITVKHESCGQIFEIAPVRLTRRHSPAKCPKCGNRSTKKKTVEDITDEVHRYGHGQFCLISDEVGWGSHKLTIQHNECGYSFKLYRNNMVVWGLSCPNCEKRKKVTPRECRTVSILESRIDQLSDGKYQLIHGYSGNNPNIVILNTETKDVEEVPHLSFMSRLKTEFPDRKIDKEREMQVLQTCVEDEVANESLGRYRLVSPYEGCRGRVAVLDTVTERVDIINYTSLHARIRKLNNHHSAYNDKGMEVNSPGCVLE